MVKGDWEDPLLRQFLPTLKEQEVSPLFLLDPVRDQEVRKAPKLLHKYYGRALLVTTGACAMHCRYCFRQHFDYATSDKMFEEELQEIANTPSLSEVLLSGGDPLSLSNANLQALLEGLDQIPHIKRLRFHTRFPIGIPERIDTGFLELLASLKSQVVFVVHCNHPSELDEEIFIRLKRIQQLGIPLLSQAVLLKGVNDDVETLAKLFMLQVDHGIIPYHLHQLDRVQGAAHFEVTKEEGRRLMAELELKVPGYALPKYVQDIPGKAHKTQITSDLTS